MKVSIFYSWQSDLPNTKNRGMINNCINKATKQLLETCSKITEFELEMDSRNESGTPDLAKSIFEKIDACDIFIADISVINSKSHERLTPNPNVLLELGYAAKTIGWSNIIGIYNSEFAEIEDLPFDIRFRKPLIYDTSSDLPKARDMLIKSLLSSIENIVDTRIIDRKEYLITKRTIDVKIQSVLLDFCRLLYETKENTAEKFNYPKLLNSSAIDIEQFLRNRELLGFHLFKNVSLNINELIQFFNDELETYFLSEKEKRILAKMVFSLRRYKGLLHSNDALIDNGKCDEYTLTSGYEMNPHNSPDSYLLLQPLADEKAIVISGGDFAPEIINRLLSNLTIREQYIQTFSQCIYDVVTLTNDWIKITGNYFIANPKMFKSTPEEH